MLSHGFLFACSAVAWPPTAAPISGVGEPSFFPLSLTDFKNNPKEYETFKKLAQDNYNNRVIHHHVFDRNLVNEICNFANFRIILSNEVKKKFPSFVFLCEKN